MVENDIKKVSKYLKVPIGKLSYTDDHIIQMKTKGEEKIIGFSSIINYLHNVVEENGSKTSDSENYFLSKQFFDFANVFIRSTSKRDKCKSSCIKFGNSIGSRKNSFLRCGVSGVKLLPWKSDLFDRSKHLSSRPGCVLHHHGHLEAAVTSRERKIHESFKVVWSSPATRFNSARRWVCQFLNHPFVWKQSASINHHCRSIVCEFLIKNS